MGRPILFIQGRPGKDGKIFYLYKFRTMENNKKNIMNDEKRITRLGHFLRTTSLDELPELFNVLKQDMSFVGPRPLLIDYLKHYDQFQMKRHDVLPGITGWAQINGRDDIVLSQKIYLDQQYLQHQSLLFDLKIILRTMLLVLKSKDVIH